jgi:predicted tellurium resistance membrane protein TerC
MGVGIMRLGRKPAHEESRSVQTKRIGFVFVNVAVALMWLRFLVRLIGQWNLMKPDIRYATVIFMAFFSLLWLTIIGDRKAYLSLAMAFGILATVYRIVWILM